jgi:hypothetical protein
VPQTYVPNIYRLELCLTYRCNVRCKNCSNLCTQAPYVGDLTLLSIENMLKESVECNHKWARIVLHGGEPTLHPEYMEICRMVAQYRDTYNNEVTLHSCSNGTNSFVESQLAKSSELRIKSEVSVKVGTNRRAGGDDIPYIPVNESPDDLKEPFDLGCFQTTECGICYNYLGFFACSPAGAAARVFGFPPACTSVKDLTASVLTCVYTQHCKHCGFAMPGRRRVIEQTNTQTWQAAFDAYGRS